MAGRRARRTLWRCLALLACLALPGRPAGAIEAFGGRIQAHGYVESVVRGISRNFNDEFDLTQWYNVLNVETDLDVAPDGFGPFDLFSGFVRVEARYDCVYTNGCEIFDSANTYGNNAKRFPGRLSDATDPNFSGVIEPLPGDGGRPRHPFPTPVGLDPPRDASGKVIQDAGFPGFDTLFRQVGADALVNTADDPAKYTFAPVADWRFGLIHVRDQLAGGTGAIGPFLPKNDVSTRAELKDRANPFRGRFTPYGGERFHELDTEASLFDPERKAEFLRQQAAGLLDHLDPRLFAIANDNSPVLNPAGIASGAIVSDFFPSVVNVSNSANPLQIGRVFGGDWTPITPCQKPTTNPGRPAQEQIRGDLNFAFCIPDGQPVEPGNPAAGGTGSNIRMIGGTGELPMRPAPDIGIFGSNAVPGTPSSDVAQGLYYPSAGLRDVLAMGSLDDPGVNLSQLQRSLNRGQSQQEENELKEAYVDVELLDSRLWGRIGKQVIVWGKTELFPTTDVVNPRDFAISSLPNLEESRISLWSGRFVYSFYDIGPFNDVRAEMAVNWDEYQPNDLGSCGEPYTLDVACGAHFGMAAHGLLGVGVAGVDRPEAPWNDLSDTEFGGRLEWRWDRFSFALVNFLGYDDLPHLKPVFYYDRNVDPRTGRPRIAGATGPCGRGFANEVAFRRNSMTAAGIGTDPDCLKGGGAPGFPNENRFRQAPDLNGDGRPDAAQIKDLIGLGGVLVVNGGFPDGTPESVDLNGDGIPDDVDGDGKPDFFGFGSTDPRQGSLENPGVSPENALAFSPANQQFFATLCSATVSIASQLEPGACAFNVFATPSPILQAGGFANFIFSEALSAFFSGEPDIGLARFMDLVVNTSIGLGPGGTQGTIPTRMLNRDRRLILDPTLLPPEFERRVGNFGDGVNTFTNVVSFNRTPTCLKPSNPPDPAGFVNPLANCIPDFAQDNIDWLSLDSSLTSEQRALLGCGPFFGSRCDSSARETDPLDSSIESFGFGGGIDFLNMEGNVLVQAWPGVEGTATVGLNGLRAGQRWLTTDRGLIQPGTVGPDAQGRYVAFDGGPVATRYIPETGETLVLPGARGLASADAFRKAGLAPNTAVLTLAPDESSITAVFEQGYNPVIDGCPLGNTENGIPVVGVEVGTGASVDLGQCGSSSDSTALVAVFSGTRFRESQPGGTDLPPSAERGGASPQVQANVATVDDSQQVRRIDGSQALFHPVAGCFDDPSGLDEGLQCLIERNYGSEFLDGLRGPGSADPANEGRIASVFRTELAAVSWNILQLLVVTSCSGDTDGFVGDPQGETERLSKPDCFTPGIDPATGLRREWMSDRCSFAAPYLCRNAQGFLNLAGVGSRRIQAGGNESFGRREFAWHSGQEVILKYERRNILGFSTDFAEDVLKSNWSFESTWIPDVTFADRAKFDGVSKRDTYNLTVSMDRPTFINFLNPNRTFFMNTQWFFQYIGNYRNSFTADGPFNVLFTVAVFTGYYQDRLIPNFISVYDINSRSGAILPSIRYRFTEAFSAEWGFLFFWGRTQLDEMAIDTVGPAVNRAGPNAYDSPVENNLALFRKRDEVFLRLRYTF